MQETASSVLEEFCASIRDRDFKKAEKIDEQIQETKFRRDEHWKIYLLIKAEYFLYKREIENSKRIIAQAEEIGAGDDRYSGFRLNYLKGFQKNLEKEYDQALFNLKNAEKNLEVVDDPLSISAVFHQLAGVYYETNRIALSVENVNKAIKIYSDNLKYRETANCYILLANNFQVIHQYIEAERYYLDALKTGEKIDYPEIRAIVNHNIGFIYSEQNKPDVAIRYLKKAVEFANSNDVQFTIKTYYLLTRELYELDRIEEGNRWCHVGIEMCKRNGDREYHYRFRLLKIKFDPDLPSFAEFESECKKIIDYFIKRKLWEFVEEYSEILAAYYSEGGQFEEACKYYQLMLQPTFRMKKL